MHLLFQKQVLVVAPLHPHSLWDGWPLLLCHQPHQWPGLAWHALLSVSYAEVDVRSHPPPVQISLFLCPLYTLIIVPSGSSPVTLGVINKSVSLFKSSQRGWCLGCYWDPPTEQLSMGSACPSSTPSACAHGGSSARESHLLLGVKAREDSSQISDSAPLPRLQIYWYPGPTLASPLWQLLSQAEALDWLYREKQLHSRSSSTVRFCYALSHWSGGSDLILYFTHW